jgi:hypothetical protein
MCAALTHASCADACRKAGYSLFGVEAGHQCYCDNALKHASETAPESECNVTCTGAHGGGGGCWPSAGRCPKTHAMRSKDITLDARRSDVGETAVVVPSSDLCGASYRLWVSTVASVPPGPPTPGPCPEMPSVQPAESRNIVNGTIMFATGYLDQS